jgi:hypothetical protein
MTGVYTVSASSEYLDYPGPLGPISDTIRGGLSGGWLISPSVMNLIRVRRLVRSSNRI